MTLPGYCMIKSLAFLVLAVLLTTAFEGPPPAAAALEQGVAACGRDCAGN